MTEKQDTQAEIKCPTCSGTGKRPCPGMNCRNGWDTEKRENCSKCNGEGEIDCINCNGTGVIKY